MSGINAIRRHLPVVYCACIGIAAGYVTYVVAPLSVLQIMTREDGPVESMGALFFLGTAVAFMRLFFKGNSKRWLLLVFALVFFFGFGEEISWGQRMFNLPVSPFFWEQNVQRELSIHNLAVFNRISIGQESKSFWELLINFDRMFSLFWFVWCFAVPVAAYMSKSVRYWIEKTGVPLIPIVVGVLFPFNYAISKGIYVVAPRALPLNVLVEIKETLFALLFLLVAVTLLRDAVKNR